MVFSSLPIFLDPPSWGQMQMQQQQPLQCLIPGGGGSDHHHLIPPPSSLAPLPGGGPSDTAASAPAGGGGGGSSGSLQAAGAQPRPAVSMAERARLARVPLPEPGTLRCPRCDSTNTKFCYFNNYSLSQPRHFCKACRRYWTRGGALRNVPVGGGCRRNTKRASKKSSRGGQQGGAGAATAATSSSSTTSTATTATTTTTTTTTSAAVAAAEAIASMQAQMPHLGLPPGAAAAALEASLEGYHHYHHHLPLQMQHQPFLQQGLHGYHFADGDGGVLADGFPRGVASSLLAQLAAVKMEEHGGAGAGIVSAHEQQYWPGSGVGVGGSSGWPAEFLSGFSSSSSGNVL